LRELAIDASAHLVELCDGLGADGARARIEAVLRDGTALDAYERWIRAQGGDPAEDALPRAPVTETVTADRSGYVGRLRALGIGTAAVRLGAGRTTKDDAIDHAVGIVCLRKRGDRVEAGEALAEIHAREESAAEAVVGEVRGAYELVETAPPGRGVVLETLS
jgi:thymidine phosphorylase